MKLAAIGVDHRSAPAAIREALAFDGPRRDRALDELRAASPGAEFVLLSTCNRVEVYALAGRDADLPSVEALSTWLATSKGGAGRDARRAPRRPSR